MVEARSRFNGGNKCRPESAIVSGSVVVAGVTYDKVRCPECKAEFLQARGSRRGKCPECGQRVLAQAVTHVRPSKESR